MDLNYLLSAQFITDCDWYDVSGPAKSSFEMEWGPGADNAGIRTKECEDGKLKMDVYSVWPENKEIMIGTYPENHGVNKKLWYAVRSGDKTLAEGKFGAWILGKGQVDVSVVGGDFPLGDETWRTKSYSVRSKGKQARFLTVIEPYENKNVVASVRALSANKLEVKLKDGRAQQIDITGIDGGEDDIKVVITEKKKGKVLRTETASNN